MCFLFYLRLICFTHRSTSRLIQRRHIRPAVLRLALFERLCYLFGGGLERHDVFFFALFLFWYIQIESCLDPVKSTAGPSSPAASRRYMVRTFAALYTRVALELQSTLAVHSWSSPCSGTCPTQSISQAGYIAEARLAPTPAAAASRRSRRRRPPVAVGPVELAARWPPEPKLFPLRSTRRTRFQAGCSRRAHLTI